MSDQLILICLAYSSASGGIAGLWKLAVFFLLSMYYAEDKVESTSLFLPLFVAVFLVGGERVNLFGYFLFLYYGLQFKGGRNYGVGITSVYWKDKESIKAWRYHEEHKIVKKRGRAIWYEKYIVRIAKVEKDYGKI